MISILVKFGVKRLFEEWTPFFDHIFRLLNLVLKPSLAVDGESNLKFFNFFNTLFRVFLIIFFKKIDCSWSIHSIFHLDIDLSSS
jgi:hypothetical protein